MSRQLMLRYSSHVDLKHLPFDFIKFEEQYRAALCESLNPTRQTAVMSSALAALVREGRTAPARNSDGALGKHSLNMQRCRATIIAMPKAVRLCKVVILDVRGSINEEKSWDVQRRKQSTKPVMKGYQKIAIRQRKQNSNSGNKRAPVTIPKYYTHKVMNYTDYIGGFTFNESPRFYRWRGDGKDQQVDFVLRFANGSDEELTLGVKDIEQLETKAQSDDLLYYREILKRMRSTTNASTREVVDKTREVLNEPVQLPADPFKLDGPFDILFVSDRWKAFMLREKKAQRR